MKTIIGIKVSPVIMTLYSHLSQKHYEYFGFIFETVAIVGLFLSLVFSHFYMDSSFLQENIQCY